MREDLRALKGENQIQDVIEEAGYKLDRREGKRYWESSTETLRVDVEKQYYYWGEEKGDVFNWLMNRHGWDFKLAIKYLQNRAKTSAFLRSKIADLGKRSKKSDDDRAVRKDKKKGYAIDRNPKKIKDRRIIKALELGVDYPEDIEKILQLDWFSVAKLACIFPDRFSVLVGGDWSDEFCVYCFRTFDEKLAARGVYNAVELGEKYELLPAESGAGLYCLDCKEMIIRWNKALLLMANYLKDQ